MTRRFLPGGLRVRLGLAAGIVAIAVGTFVLVGPSGAAPSSGGFSFAYTAKYACVPEVGPAASMFIPQGPATALTYRTVINVHNPQFVPVRIGKKAAAGATEFQPPGQITQVKILQLIPNQALAINCADIASLFGVPQPNGDGIVEVMSDLSLDVWAAYTMRGTSSGGLNGNIDVVMVPERALGP